MARLRLTVNKITCHQVSGPARTLPDEVYFVAAPADPDLTKERLERLDGGMPIYLSEVRDGVISKSLAEAPGMHWDADRHTVEGHYVPKFVGGGSAFEVETLDPGRQSGEYSVVFSLYEEDAGNEYRALLEKAQGDGELAADGKVDLLKMLSDTAKDQIKSRITDQVAESIAARVATGALATTVVGGVIGYAIGLAIAEIERDDALGTATVTHDLAATEPTLQTLAFRSDDTDAGEYEMEVAVATIRS